MIIIDALLVVAVIFILACIVTRGRIISAVWNRFIVASDAAAEAARDPAADGHVAVVTAEREHEEMKALRRKLLTQVKNFEDERDMHVAEVNKYEALAQAAGKAKNIEDVKTALKLKAESQEDVDLLQKEIDRHNDLAGDMEQKIRTRGSEIAEAKRDQTRLSSSIQFDNMRTRAAQDVKQFGDTNSALARLRADARNASNRAEVAEDEVRIGAPNLALEEKYATDNGPTDEDIAKYMGQDEPAPAA